jgi:hypothetical protein
VRKPEIAKYWTPDEAAECLDGIRPSVYCELWMFVGDDKPNTTVFAIWPKLSDEAKEDLSKAFEAIESSFTS